MIKAGDRICPIFNSSITEHIVEVFEDCGIEYAVCKWRVVYKGEP